MARLTAHVRQALTVLLCLSLVVWSVMPKTTHTPSVIETVHDHLEMIAEHGHSHGFEEDLYWAMHGHSHDVADHDHNQAYLTPSQSSEPSAAFREPRLRVTSTDGPKRQFRIDRPPRA